MIAILGTGKMGEALLSGLLRAGRPPSDVAVVVRREARGDDPPYPPMSVGAGLIAKPAILSGPRRRTSAAGTLVSLTSR